MLLAIDIGNTNTTIGIFKNKELIFNFRLTTKIDQTMDEYGVFARNLLLLANVNNEDIKGIVVSCVVPPLEYVISRMGRKYFSLNPMFVKPGIKTGVSLNVESPSEVGADRIVDCVAAINKYEPPLIVIDFGTATTFDAISKNNEFLGGAIAPGLKITAASLTENTSKLPEVVIKKPEKVIGRNTITNIQSGLFYGYVGLVEKIVENMKLELGEGTQVVATGGLAKIITSEMKQIDYYDKYLTLDGLRILYEKNFK